ncbi:cob(I)yrinic acid a,c-diamide adenosyltransferase [Patescibacteria group bacterium]|nr:cob(I)yrinic acid a,c-diamide adenosyltransferase [Patescibacteria group bacterium]
MAKLTASRKGLVIIYTGEGKGKTTAAIGLAVRAAGYKRRVAIVQFVKTWFTGEKAGFEGLADYVEFTQAGKGFYQILGDKLPPEEHRRAAAAAFELAKQKVESNQYGVVILDEIIGTVVGGLLPLETLLALIDRKPEDVDLVLTGRHADTLPGLIDRADLVTEMVKVKHPYDMGVIARKSIDY